MVEKLKDFDWQRYQLKDSVDTVILDVEGESLELRIKKLGYVRKNKLVSECYVYGQGTVGFDHDKYGREALKAVIVEAPWGKTNEMFLISLDDSPLTAALETLIPPAFTAGNSLDEVKKD